MPFWEQLLRRAWAMRAVAGVNAAVVGLLAAAFLDPVLAEGIGTLGDVAIVIAGFVLLQSTRLSPLWIVAFCVVAGVLLQMPA